MPLHWFGALTRRPSCFPDGRVGFAVGDIHGRADLLERMIARIEHECAGCGLDPAVIFLGDYVDRGPDSADVVTMLLEWRPEGIERRFLKGNHEDAMLAFVDDPVSARPWLVHGGLETMASYAVAPLPGIAASEPALRAAADQLRASIPENHLEFFRVLERFVVMGDYAFVHAGVDFSRPIGKQRDEDLYWARHRFLADRRHYSHVIVHGHTPTDAPYRDQRRICVDTGAYITGRLTAARFEADEVSFLVVEREN